MARAAGTCRLHREGKELFEVQLEVWEMESGTMAIQEREDEIAQLAGGQARRIAMAGLSMV